MKDNHSAPGDVHSIAHFLPSTEIGLCISISTDLFMPVGGGTFFHFSAHISLSAYLLRFFLCLIRGIASNKDIRVVGRRQSTANINDEWERQKYVQSG